MTERDLDIIETLACRVRVMTLSQIANLWCEGDVADTLEHLNQLALTGAIEHTKTYSQYEKRSECVFRWTPTDQEPSFEQIVESRFAGQRTHNIAGDIYTATRFAANLFASEFTEFPSPEERPEQLRLSDAYVAHCSSRSTEASFWFNCRAGESNAAIQEKPDVLVADLEGSPLWAISLLSRSVQRFKTTHVFCVNKGIPYELW